MCTGWDGAAVRLLWSDCYADSSREGASSAQQQLRVVKIIDRPSITTIDGNRMIGWMY